MDVAALLSFFCRCGITQLSWSTPWDPLRPLVIREFFSKADVINAMEASGWTPLWIAPGLSVNFRDYGPCIDGFATSFLPDPLNCKRVRALQNGDPTTAARNRTDSHSSIEDVVLVR